VRGTRTSCAGIESAISMSAGAESPFASGVASGSVICCAGLGDGSAIVDFVEDSTMLVLFDA
jgi:hypothetical protein